MSSAQHDSSRVRDPGACRERPAPRWSYATPAPCPARGRPRAGPASAFAEPPRPWANTTRRAVAAGVLEGDGDAVDVDSLSQGQKGPVSDLAPTVPAAPGVSIRSRSPGRSSPAAFEGSGSPFSRFRPGRAVGRRRRGRRGACRRRSVISVKRIGASASSSRTIPSPPRCSPGAAAAAAQRKLAHPQRELGLERLDRGVERVRHRHVDGARPVGVRAGALAAADRLVVGELARSPRVRLFIVPWPCAGAARASRAPRAPGRRPGSRSRRCRRRPRPAGARSAGSPPGRATSTGRKAPAEGGASGSVSTRTAKKAADLVTGSGQLRLPVDLRVGAGEVERQPLAVDRRR